MRRHQFHDTLVTSITKIRRLEVLKVIKSLEPIFYLKVRSIWIRTPKTSHSRKIRPARRFHSWSPSEVKRKQKEVTVEKL